MNTSLITAMQARPCATNARACVDDLVRWVIFSTVAALATLLFIAFALTGDHVSWALPAVSGCATVWFLWESAKAQMTIVRALEQGQGTNPSSPGNVGITQEEIDRGYR